MTARQLFDFPPFPRKSIFENNEEEKPPTKCFVEMPQKAECEKNYKTKEKPNKQMPTKKTKTSFFSPGQQLNYCSSLSLETRGNV